MRSSRLLSILLLLQTRGRMTAAQLARELEVSVRTIYRDAEALAASGVPVYGDAGHSGGYQLHDGYRTRVTGLAPGEAEALFLAGLPGPAAELGLGQALSATRLRLRAALPPELRTEADRLRRRFHLDAPGWYADHAEVPFLPQVADAVWRGRVIEVRLSAGGVCRLEPYGLVLKAGRWYLVAGPGPCTYPVDGFLSLAETGDEAGPPEGFDLAAHWQAAEAAGPQQADVRLSPRGAARISCAQARALAVGGAPDGADGWVRATLPVDSLDAAEREFLSLGTDVEVLGPPELRARLARTAATLAERYG
ncbi:WYL domain-containing protein [Streptomyces bambusae]|uniref:helix-turn-helix transcriptional regulator n=1 Tax=Streptomyces bambusae TaxID=1550616 RepID=UPI001CFCDA4C|nr:WYL domain-containing protein [Streptomyces bambusae]MCB5167613.1 WYL domain-containing protein [Streptomyces bambusae]